MDEAFLFLKAACVPRDDTHTAGTLEQAEAILAEYPDVADSSIYAAAVLGKEAAVQRFLSRDGASATVRGGPYQWDALTYLCFSRYLRLDPPGKDFVGAARALLDAGASANTGWTATVHRPEPHDMFESALYGAAALAKHAGLTRLLLERGADPNDEETPYHVPEGYDNRVMSILLESGKLNAKSLACMLARKADWHDLDGLTLLLEHGADPNFTANGVSSPLQHALRRDNSLAAIALLLEHGADPKWKNARDGRSAITIAARRGRGDVLRLFAERGFATETGTVDELIASCATGDVELVQRLRANHPELVAQLLADAGALLAEFSGNGNTEGVRCLLDSGIEISSRYEGDGYFEIAKDSTALHVAAWRAWPATVEVLLERGAPVNERDAKGRTPLMLAVRACVDSYWTDRRSPESIRLLLGAGATAEGVSLPTGYAEADELLRSVS